MLDHYLTITREKMNKQAAASSFVDRLALLPPGELRLVQETGEIKLAYCDEEWVQKFVGSPLLSKALELAEQQLRSDAEQDNHRRERQAMNEEFDQERESLRLERRLLELELIKSNAGVASPAMATPPPADAPPPLAAPAAPMAEKSAMADSWGRSLARSEADRVEDVEKMADVGKSMLAFAKNNPAMLAGGALGLAHGLTSEDGGLGTGILEAAGGASLGASGQALYRRYGAKIPGMGAPPPQLKMATIDKEAFGAMLAKGLQAAVPAAMNWMKSNPLKAGLGAVSAVSNFHQARQGGDSLGGALLSGAGGAAGAAL